RDVAQPDLSEHAEAGFDEEVNLESRIAVAQIDGAAFEHQPIPPPVDGNPGKPKFRDVPRLAWRRVREHVTTNIPHQKVGIQIRGVNEVVAKPSLCPNAHFFNDRE